MDHLTKEKRSLNMRKIGSKNTKPELLVRKMLHNNGIRFRLHAKDLPGKPDISNKSKGFAIFVNGCFWHRHGCKYTTTPKSNKIFWIEKFNKTVERDKKHYKQLANNGWRTIILWECELNNSRNLDSLLKSINKKEKS